MGSSFIPLQQRGRRVRSVHTYLKIGFALALVIGLALNPISKAGRAYAATPSSITITWSSAHPSWISMTLDGFSPGTYTYSCDFGSGGNQSFTLTESTSPQTFDGGNTCYDTIAGDTVWVVINGVQSNVITVGSATPPPPPTGGAVYNSPGCSANVLPANDDGSTGRVDLPFSINFFGTSESSLFVNNNGNVTFDAPLSTYTPFNISSGSPPIIAPFFADVDTRGSGSGLVTYGATTFEGYNAFCVDWPNVGYYDSHTDKLNTFQLLIVQRSDVAPGAFDIVFNYNSIQWETGDASGGSGGLGGTSATVGYSAGTGAPGTYFQLSGSLVNGAFLDSNNTTGLANSEWASAIPGRYVIHISASAPGAGSVTNAYSRSYPTTGLGYAFTNQGLSSYLTTSNLNASQVLNTASLSPTFSDWNQYVASNGGSNTAISHLVQNLEGGLCYGWSLSSGRFDGGDVPLYDPATGRSASDWLTAQNRGLGESASTVLPPPGTFGSSTYNQQILQLLSTEAASQFSTQVVTSEEMQHHAYADPTTGFNSLVAQLESVLGRGVDLYDSSGQLSTAGGNNFAMIAVRVFNPTSSGTVYAGHALLAYSMEFTSDGYLKIDVVDPNEPLTHYAILVSPNGVWDYTGPDPFLQGMYSMGPPSPGLALGLIDVLPLYRPIGLSYQPNTRQARTLGSGGLVDTVPGATVGNLSDATGHPVDIEAVPSASTVANGGLILNFPGDSGNFDLSGSSQSADVRGVNAYMTVNGTSGSGTLSVGFDGAQGSISAVGGSAQLSVSRAGVTVTSTGVQGLTVDSDGSVTTSGDSGSVIITVTRNVNGVDVSANLYSGPGSGSMSFTAQEVLNSVGVAPQTPRDLVVTGGKHSVTASWVAGTGSTFVCTLYYGYRDPSNFVIRTSGRSCSFSGLSSKTSWGIGVTAVNSYGTSPQALGFAVTL